MNSLCVFCGASQGNDPSYRQAAVSFGAALAREHIELVWGGGQIGLMGVVADAVLAAGGRAYGVIPDFMAERELAHRDATQMMVVDSMHARKAAMADRADAFVALPGGFGTLDELFEIVTWAQLHIHRKPIGILNVKGFFDPLMAMVRHMSATGFINPHYLGLLNMAATPDELLASMRSHRPLTGDWLGARLSSEQG